jgi:hypothetical protein
MGRRGPVVPVLRFVFKNVLLLASIVADPDPSDRYVLGLLDPDPDLLVRGLDPDPSITKQK